MKALTLTQNTSINRQWQLASRPVSAPTPANFQVASGQIKFCEDVVDGLENALAAFIGLLEGRNFGKLIVRVASNLLKVPTDIFKSSTMSWTLRVLRCLALLRACSWNSVEC